MENFAEISFDDWLNLANKQSPNGDYWSLVRSKESFDKYEVQPYYENDLSEKLEIPLRINEKEENFEIIELFRYDGSILLPEVQVALAIYQVNLSESVKFEIVVDLDSKIFKNIAKLRALRYSIAKVGDLSNIDIDLKLRAIPANYNKSTLDIDNNIIRQTLEAFSSTVGGADIYDPYYSSNSTASNINNRRIMGNIQNIIDSETFLSSTYDHLFGSEMIDKYTKAIFNKAITIAQDLQNTSDPDEIIFKLIKQEVEQANKNFYSLKDKYIGVNIYPNQYHNEIVSLSNSFLFSDLEKAVANSLKNTINKIDIINLSENDLPGSIAQKIQLLRLETNEYEKFDSIDEAVRTSIYSDSNLVCMIADDSFRKFDLLSAKDQVEKETNKKVILFQEESFIFEIVSQINSINYEYEN